MVMPMGVCYGPYHQKDKAWSSYTSADIDAGYDNYQKIFSSYPNLLDAGRWKIISSALRLIIKSESVLESGFTKETGMELNRKSILLLAKRLVSPGRSYTSSSVTKLTAENKITVQTK
jgi:hypothetical protein